MGVVGVGAYAIFNKKVFPIVNVNIRVTQNQAITQADNFLKSEGFSSSGYERVVIFDGCATEYLQEKVGIDKTIALLQKDVPCWSWEVRYFRELQEEGFYVSIDPLTGKAMSFSHVLPENSEGKKFTQEEARKVTEEVWKKQGENLTQYELKTSSRKDRPQRSDYFFEWEKKDFKAGDATMKVSAGVQGDRVGMFSKYLDVPEKFYRELSHKTTVGRILTLIFSVLIGIISISSLFILLRQYKFGSVRWRLAALWGGALLPIPFLNFYNELPLFWFRYPDTMYKAMYIGMAVVMLCLTAVFACGVVLLLCAAGESLARQLDMPGFYLWESLKNPPKLSGKITSIYVIGYSFGLCMLGYEILFYFVGTRWAHIWVPLSFSYTGMLSSKMPFLEPLTVGAIAAITEEFLFRLYMINLFTALFKKPWLAILMQAVLWAFAHSNYAVYPNFTRGIELTVVGIVLGIIYLRCGIEATVIAHYVYNAMTAGWFLLTSDNYYLKISAILVLLLVFFPILPVFLFKRIQNKAAG